MGETKDHHVMEVLGLAVVTVENGKIVSIEPPKLRFCPLFNKLLGIENIDTEAVRKNIEFRIKDFGLFTENRVTRAGDYITFGVSEILSTALSKGQIQASVIVADGAGSFISEDPEIVQGMCGRISGIIETSPLKKVIADVGPENVLDPDTAKIDQKACAEKAAARGYERFSVTVTNADDAKFIREKYGSRAVIIAVHTSGTSRCDAKAMFDNCDFITACASGPLREEALSRRDDIIIAGNKVQIFAVTDIGKEMVVGKLHSIGKEPWDGSPEWVNPNPLLRSRPAGDSSPGLLKELAGFAPVAHGRLPA